ncbi:MAG: hypothetical protein O8C61_10490 [Candidatus Methanoperedens sp.]|nr:hypothetical protein [Candidatus Methanoperedens sp.]
MKIRVIRVIRVLIRDWADVSYMVTGMAELCALCVLCGDFIKPFADSIFS